LRIVEHSCCRREQFLILDGDVPLIQDLQLGQALTQLRGVGRRQTVLREPTLHKHTDGGVVGVGLIVIMFKTVYQRHRCHSGRVAATPKSREETLFFIGRVLWRGNGEVSQRCFERAAVCKRQRPASGLGVHDSQDMKEVLDPSMAVAQQPERFIQVVTWWLSDPNWHCSLQASS
jgi:hypothetical protein